LDPVNPRLVLAGAGLYGDRVPGLLELLPVGRHRVRIALDEGGLRCTWGDAAAHVPWTIIADVTLEEALWGSTLLRLVDDGGEDLRIKLEHADPLDLQREMLLQIAELEASKGPRELPAPFERGERELDAWLDASRALVSGEHIYRDVQIDREIVVAVLASEHAAVDARAAAAYALIATGDDHELVSAAKTFVLRALPPLVLVAARLARGGAALVDDEVLDEVTVFLPERDRVVVDRMRPIRDPQREMRLTAALERAKAEVTEELRAAQVAPTEGSKLRRVHIASAGVDTRWVGRTWSL